ncbi:conjugal transfer protein TraD [Vibrio parahaemolyticus]
MIEPGVLVVKAGLVELVDNNRALMLGVLSEAAALLPSN